MCFGRVVLAGGLLAACCSLDSPARGSDLSKFLHAVFDDHHDRPGEPPQTVRKFVESLKYTHPVVLDPDQEAAAAFRVTSLPVTVLIGKDGTVQSAHVGFSTEDRALIRKDMEQLVEGKQLVETSGG